MNQLHQEFEQKVLECIELAQEKYGIDLGNVDIKFDIKGTRIAGQAWHESSTGEFGLRFHPDAVENHYQKMVDETIPHEVAHLVCMKDPSLGSHHDSGWAKVCISLGGVDSRTHAMKFGRPVRKLKTFEYKSECGEVVTFTSIRHNKLQRGKVLAYIVERNGKRIRLTKDNLVK